jgi:hypothetical protein
LLSAKREKAIRFTCYRLTGYRRGKIWRHTFGAEKEPLYPWGAPPAAKNHYGYGYALRHLVPKKQNFPDAAG